jgi:hypothetical protein
MISFCQGQLSPVSEKESLFFFEIFCLGRNRTGEKGITELFHKW